ncbi:MAG TPA: succinate dehydrogenase cytochrome b subunit [Kofleriaceae bacterium]|jgi:succinate dehydrogenase / fumarate reductase cytochrome b subunit|nr:succinate dehydrogenase cytochrome b subunit [Kofleriaceae bacterium]
MSWFISYVRSSVGAKQIMAVTGLLLLLFALQHMVGHFGMFKGRDAYNAYAHFLQGLGALKWLVRVGLLAILVVHIVAAISLSKANASARPQKYAVARYIRTSLFARTMLWTGLTIFVFLGFHIAHFTVGWVQPDSFHLLDDKGRYDAYSMFVLGFKNWGILAFYLVATALLSMHLAHGASSWFQSLGWRHPKYDGLIDKLGPVLAVIMIVGYAAPPLAVAFNLIKL